MSKAKRGRFGVALVTTIAVTAVALCATVVLLLFPGCRIVPREMAMTREPRTGRPLAKRVAVVYSMDYGIHLGGLEKQHAFDINKYDHIYMALVKAGVLRAEDVFVPPEVTDEQLLLVHSFAYLRRLNRSPKEVGKALEQPGIKLLPPSKVRSILLGPFRRTAGGTLLAARLALEHGAAINIGGGYHHAFAGHGEGFCVYADIPIAIRWLQNKGIIKRAMIVDVDVHHGNGNAFIFARDPTVFIFDMYEEDIYPSRKWTVDVAVKLKAGTGDKTYLALLREKLPEAIRRAKPDLIILNAGVDVHWEDPLASLRLTTEGIIRRDEFVVAEAVKRKIPILVLTAGGYSAGAWKMQFASFANIIRMLSSEESP
ncbi:MAG: histone deacetylase [Planctomycetia bacterium]|nr:histone deacetylase [Planctomycetia bacterium]